MTRALGFLSLCALALACGSDVPEVRPPVLDGAPDVPAIPDGPEPPDASDPTDAASADGPPALVAACGVPGRRCCDYNRCNDGGCCLFQRCFAGGTPCGEGGRCAGGTCGACGGPDQPCCPGDLCTTESTICQMGQCRRCGGAEQPCCPGERRCFAPHTRCQPSGTSESCVACGAVGEDCCPGQACQGSACCHMGRCLAVGASCGNAGTCDEGVCSGCGDPGQPCCANGECRDRTICQAGSCQPCGGRGQPCCLSFAGARIDCDEGSICGSAGAGDFRCEDCGGPTQRCCPGARCLGDACCVSGTCFAPGAICQDSRETSVGGPRITTTYGLCERGRCTGCGQPGMPCCPPPDSVTSRRRDLCGPGAICLSDGGAGLICALCGGPGQPCCDTHVCQQGCCSPQFTTGTAGTCLVSGARCGRVTTDPAMDTCDGATGSCGPCGGIGQPCCNGSTCLTSARCESGVCRSCGGLGEPCCQYGECGNGLACGFFTRCLYPPP